MNRAYDQLLMDVALHRAGVTIVEDRAGVTGNDGASHNGMWDIALAATVPGLRLAAPRDEATLREELREALAVDNAPTIVRYPKGSLPNPIPALRRENYGDVLWESAPWPQPTPQTSNTASATAQPTPQTSARRILIAATGALARLGIELGRDLAQNGIGITVVDPLWLLPVSPALQQFCAGFDWIVTLEDGLVEGGFGSQLRDALAARDCFLPVISRGIPKAFLAHASRAEILEEIGLTRESLGRDIAQIIGKS